MRWALMLVVVMACSKGTAAGTSESPAPASTMPRPAQPARDPGAAVILTPPGGVPTRVSVEVMRTQPERERGLMYRERLDTDHGMIFLFPGDEVHTFWMKNTLIPLDMIFIAADGDALTVAGVVANAEPRTLTGRTIGKPSRHVLEVTAGWAQAHGVVAGTKVQLEHIDLEGVSP